MEKRWQILGPETGAVENIKKSLGCDAVTATLLVNRNITDADRALKFLNPSLNAMRPPFDLKDADHAAERIASAIDDSEKILIFGDYDVDGITSTTVLCKFLHYAGADVSYYIPHRTTEGYGLSAGHITDHAIPKKIDLIITVDCGSGSHEAVEAARNAGIDVIITDHHNISENMPPAYAVVNPKRPDCGAGFENLAGVGVAFCLVICLRKYLRDRGFWETRVEPNLRDFCDLVALGTIADVVPLVDENRIFSRTGLELINTGARIGVDELVKASGIEKGATDATDVSFRLAPRLNAAGRIEHAKIAAELLASEDRAVAERIAKSLTELNKRRQAEEKRILADIIDLLKTSPHLLSGNTLVLAEPGWNEGVLGIVASKIVDKYYRPVILIGIRNGIGKGSGRSIPGIDLHRGLSVCADALESYGGHRMAAGVKLKTEDIDRFAGEFENAVTRMTTPDVFSPIVTIDCELDFNRISEKLIDEIESLEPFGEGNPEPLFLARNVAVVSSKIVGRNHRRMTLTQPGKSPRNINAIQFDADISRLESRFEKMTYRLRWNRYRNLKTPQVVVIETDHRS